MSHTAPFILSFSILLVSSNSRRAGKLESLYFLAQGQKIQETNLPGKMSQDKTNPMSQQISNHDRRKQKGLTLYQHFTIPG